MGIALSAPATPTPSHGLSSLPGASRAGDIERLRREISRMQRRTSDARTLPLDSALQGLLPEDGLRVGAAYSLTPSPSLLGALLSAPSQAGSWCAAVGMPTIGAEAMAGFGVDLSRFVLVPDPGPRWLSVVSALSDVIPLIAVHPRSRVPENDLARLHARLRDRGCTLLVTGAWPHSEAHIRIENSEWHGLGTGWGLLSERTVTLQATARGQAHSQRVRVSLPGALGKVKPVTHAAHAPLVSLPRPQSAPAPTETDESVHRWAEAG